MELTGTQFGIKSGGVDTTQLNDGGVTEDKLDDGAVSAQKLSNITANGTSGQILASDGTGGFSWTDDSDTTYSADGSTLDLTGTQFSIMTGGVNTTQLSDGAVTPLKLSSISGNGTSGQLLSSDGSGGFSWADDSDTTYTADGTTLKLDGTEFGIEDGGVDEDQLADGGVTPAKLTTPAKHTLYVTASPKTGVYTVTEDDGVLLADTTSGDVAFTLPAAVGAAGRTYSFYLASGGNSLVVWPTGAETIDGDLSYTVDDLHKGATFISDGSNWLSLANNFEYVLENGAVTALKLYNVNDNGTSGQLLASDGTGGFSWVDDQDTTYTADGSTLELTGTEFGIKAGGVDTTQLNDGGVTGAKLDDGAVSALKLSSISVNGTSGQILASNGTGGFAWADDVDTTYTADESTLTLSADNRFSVKDAGVTSTQLGDGAVIEAKINDGAVTGDKLGSGAVIAGKIGADAVDATTISLNAGGKLYVPAGAVNAGTLEGHDSTYFVAASHTHPYWSLSGDSGTDPSADFLGTTDRVSLVLRVNNEPVFRFIPAELIADYDSPSIVGGHSGNTVGVNVTGAFIGGGGKASFANSVTDHFGSWSAGLRIPQVHPALSAGEKATARAVRIPLSARDMATARAVRIPLSARDMATARAVNIPLSAGEKATARAITGPLSARDMATARAVIIPLSAGEKATARAVNIPLSAGEKATARAVNIPLSAGEKATARAVRIPLSAGDMATARAVKLPLPAAIWSRSRLTVFLPGRILHR